MTQNPDIQYIRVRHLNQTQGSLLLEDLDTEENKKQPYTIPVYIPESGFVDLPMNDQVLLSFNQGTLRSFIDQGFVSGFVIQDDGSAEVFVSPYGSDDNPGTQGGLDQSIWKCCNIGGKFEREKRGSDRWKPYRNFTCHCYTYECSC